MSEREIRTFCRVCEPACGLVASVRDGRLEKLAPDRAHPVTHGFACNKGLAGLEIHHDPDRLEFPLGRGASGRLRARLVGRGDRRRSPAKLREIIAAHGPNAVASYVGNPTAFNTLAGPAIGAFVAQLGSQAHVLVRHAGLREQVRGQRGGVRLEHDPPDPGPRAHRLRARVRREPARLPRQLHLDRRPGARAARRAQARGEALLREPARDRVGRAGRDDPDPARHRPVLHGGAAVRARPAQRARPRDAARPRRARRRAARVRRALPGGARRARDRRTRRRRFAGWPREIGGGARRVGAHVDRREHGPAGDARVLAPAHAVVREREPRPPRREHPVGRLLPGGEGGPARVRRRASPTPSSAGCAAARCRAT